jgi:N-acetylglucosamine-6-phosphate deacetylase
LPDLAGRIVTLDGIMAGRLRFSGRVDAIEPLGPAAPDACSRGDASAAPLILPGFVDLHVHGGGGADAMRGEGDVRAMARFHARHGTTSLLPTTVTAADRDLLAAAGGVGAVADAPGPDEARVLGLHLEGPYINPRRLGAQPPLTRPPDLALLARLDEAVDVRIVTLAPELDPGLAFTRQATAAGVRCQVGHSDASYEQAREALAAGAAGFTHLFNAMRPFSHRDPGTAGAALVLGTWAEIIPDMLHVAGPAVRLALCAIPNLYAVTDAIEAAGCPDGPYQLGGREVVKEGGRACLRDGTLAGSLLTMDQAFRNLVGLGLDPWEASRRTSTLPADYLGHRELGRIEPGMVADIVVLGGGSDGLGVARVFVGGEEIDVAHD